MEVTDMQTSYHIYGHVDFFSKLPQFHSIYNTFTLHNWKPKIYGISG